MSHSFFAMGAAVSQSSAKNSFTAIDASLILPAAFILGAIVYPMNEVVILRLVWYFESLLVDSISSISPGRVVFSIRDSP